jgi:hypothetical protein
VAGWMGSPVGHISLGLTHAGIVEAKSRLLFRMEVHLVVQVTILWLSRRARISFNPKLLQVSEVVLACLSATHERPLG